MSEYQLTTIIFRSIIIIRSHFFDMIQLCIQPVYLEKEVEIHFHC